jgi:CHAT domain-containing protein
MARNWFRSLLLLPVLLATFAAAPESEEKAAFREASLLCERGDWKAASPYIDVALERFRGSDADAVWGLVVLRGKVLIGLNDASSAIVALAPALPIRLAHSDIEVRRLTYLATANYRDKHYSVADPLLVRAEKLARSYQPRMIGEVLLYRSSFEYARKHQAEALRYGRAAAAAARRYRQPAIEIKAISTLALVRTDQQHYDEAIDLGLRQLTLARASGAESTIEKVEGNLAWAYESIGDFENASILLNDAIPLATRLRADHDLMAWLNLFGDIARMRGDNAGALRYYEQGLAIARKATHRDLADFIANLARARLEAGDLRAARLANEEASTLARSQNDQAIVIRSLLIDARIDAASGQLDSAVAKAQRVLESEETKPWQRWEAEARLAQFYVAANRSTDADKHFQRAIDTAAEARKDVKSDELRLPFGALVREVYNDYVFFLMSNDRVAEALAAAEMSRVQTLAEALDAGPRSQRVDPKHLARDRRAVLLSYWLTPKRSYVWTITPYSIDFAELPPANTIEQKVESYSREILSLRASNASLTAHGAELFRMLVEPVAKRIPKSSRVIIVPDGRLHAFNMETLVDPSTRRYWIEDVTIETAGSLELLDRPRTGTPPASMLLVGDPPSPAPEFPRLTKAAEEMGLVQQHFVQTCTTLKGAGATPRAYENANAGRYGYVHFVAHGIATRQRPLDSAVVLARDGDSYKLYARDILKHRLHAGLVTISSCQGAGTRAYTGEGLVGLAWAFLHAGARQVIAALWEVNDNATPRMMDDLYTGIRAGQDPPTALRAAKLKLIHGGTVYRQPKYWGPFVLYSGS